jgi:hypothetical protein
VLRSEIELLVRHFDAHHVNPERAPRLLVVTPRRTRASRSG